MKRQHGFTLIELLVVISIIMILAGLTLSLFRYGNTKGATERARAEISGLSLALESYKIEYGDYPRDENTDALDPKTNGNAHIPSTGHTPYTLASAVMYKALSGDINLDGKGGDIDTNTNEKNQVFFEFKAGMLYPRVTAGTIRPGDKPVSSILDPFRNVYGYSTIGSKTKPVVGEGFNPTFDLWSTADAEGNKTLSDDTTRATWIKNW